MLILRTVLIGKDLYKLYDSKINIKYINQVKDHHSEHFIQIYFTGKVIRLLVKSWKSQD